MYKQDETVKEGLIQSCESQTLLDLGDGLARVQSLRTSSRAIKNRVAPIQAHAVVQHVFPLLLMLISAIGQPAV